MAIKNRLITGANFRDFDWNKAKLFYHIVKCGSYVKAAEIAGTDQPALTRQMQGLEEQLGCPLLIRKPGFGIALTRRGEDLYKMVEPFFAEVRGFCGETYVEVGGEKKRKIRISTSHALAAYVINDLVIEYNKQHSHLSFEVIVNDHSIDVILDDIDIAIHPYDVSEKAVQRELLFTLHKRLFASEGYLDKYGEPMTIEELKNHRFLSYPNPLDYPYSDVTWVLKIGMPEGNTREPFFASNSVECLVDAAKNDMGIISGYEQMKIFRDSKLKVILPHVKTQIVKEYLTCPNYLKEDREITNIKNHLRAKLDNEKLSH